MRRLNEAAEQLIQGFEELRLRAYDDALPNKILKPGDTVAGTLTNGWGHTGSDVWIGQLIDEAKAEQWWLADIGDTILTVERAVRVPLTDNQFGALVSFAYNVGDDAFRGSTLLRALNAGRYVQVPRELAKWTKTTENGKKVTSRGLIRRRAAEANLWASAGAPDVFETGESAGNQVGEPPAQKSVATDAVVTGSVLAGAGAILSDIARQIEPLVPYGDTIKWLFLAMSLASIGLVVWSRIRAIRHEAA